MKLQPKSSLKLCHWKLTRSFVNKRCDAHLVVLIIGGDRASSGSSAEGRMIDAFPGWQATSTSDTTSTRDMSADHEVCALGENVPVIRLGPTLRAEMLFSRVTASSRSVLQKRKSLLLLIAWETCTLSTHRPGLALEYFTLFSFSFLTFGRWQEGGQINQRRKENFFVNGVTKKEDLSK